MLRYAAITDKGICEKNDDRIVVANEVCPGGKLEGEAGIYIIAAVCDGVGGYLFGDKAADITARTIAALPLPTVQAEIEKVIADANNKVLSVQETNNERNGMASTVAGVYVEGDSFIAFNVGDSKVFRFRSGYLTQISTDHTYASESVKLGVVLSENEIDEVDRHKITRCIGDKRNCQPNMVVGEKRIFNGDVFLLCSDGLSDNVSIEEIETVLSEPSFLHEKCGSLVKLALENGSEDNISVVLLEVCTDGEN